MRSSFLIKVFIFILLVVTFSKAFGAEADCSALRSSKVFHGLVKGLRQASTIEAMGYRLSQHNFLFLHPSAPLCAALYRSGQVEIFNLAGPIVLENDHYSFRNMLNPLDAQSEKSLRPVIVDRGVATFFIYNMRDVKSARTGEMNTLDSHMALLVHESFHLFHQRSERGDEQWSGFEGRKFLSDVCYGGKYPVVKKLVDKEVDALANTLKVSDLNARAASYASFRQSRNQRLQALGDNHAPCEKAERVMERTEGEAKYVESVYLRELGLSSKDDLIHPARLAPYLNGFNYYVIGFLQRLIGEGVAHASAAHISDARAHVKLVKK